MKSKFTIFALSAIAAVIIFSCETRTYDDISGGVISHPTYEKDIKPIMDNNCTSCHQAGSQDPDLTNYQNVKDNAETIYTDINDGSMPQGADKLQGTTIETFKNWINDGMPQN